MINYHLTLIIQLNLNNSQQVKLHPNVFIGMKLAVHGLLMEVVVILIQINVNGSISLHLQLLKAILLQ